MTILRYAEDKILKNIEKLEKRDKYLHRQVMNALINIQEDPACGIKISHRLIPKIWRQKYKIDNLYKYNLPNAWRLFYSLVGGNIEIIAIILACLNHKEYERLFNY